MFYTNYKAATVPIALATSKFFPIYTNAYLLQKLKLLRKEII